MYRLFFILVLLVSIAAHVPTHHTDSEADTIIPWVENTLEAMTLEEKIGQMIMIRASSKDDAVEKQKIMNIIRIHDVGGMCFFQGHPAHQAQLINAYQRASKVPLMVSIDGEWGLGMRFPKTTISYPRQLMLGAIQDNNLIYRMGRDIGRQLQRVGIHVNFAPVADVNNNPRNPVINDRSFGEDKFNVAAKSYAYAQGMQDEGIMACAKHFPGHGDTDVDSHYDLPVIPYDRDRLDELELMPFQSLAEDGIQSMMVAHLHLPQLDDREHRPSTLSRPIVTGLLREDMDYEGLIFTDAMEMRGVTKHFPDGVADAEAVLAGNDIILLPNDVRATVAAIKTYVETGKVSLTQIDASVRRILTAKHMMGLSRTPQVPDIPGIIDEINTKQSLALKAELIEHAITAVRDEASLLPLTVNNSHRYAVLSIGSHRNNAFQTRCKHYATIRTLSTDKDITSTEKRNLIKDLAKHEHVIVALHDMSKLSSKNFGISESSLDFLETLAKAKNVTLVAFGSPYALKYLDYMPTVVIAYNEDEITQDITAQALFGAIDIKGKLPVTASERARYGDGLYIAANGTLGYSLPERVGMDSEVLLKIDSVMQSAREIKAAPGGQVFVAKDGKIVWNRSYGYHTYDTRRPVAQDDMYDLASVTKILASTISLMKLYDQGKFDLRSPLRRYMPSADTCDKKDLIMEDLLAHQARLAGWIPFYKRTLTDGKKARPSPKYYTSSLTPSFTIPVANKMFLRSDYRDTIWARIMGSQLRDTDAYRYSDLAFYMVHDIVEHLTQQSIDQYVMTTFYNPLGLDKTGYLPLQRFKSEQIAPTEEDSYFRMQRLQGHVHDMGAAMLGGISGHAGLFSTASETGILMQMLLNGGHYGGTEFFSPATVGRFTTRYYRSTRRGIGFDLKQTDTTKRSNMCEEASRNTFGHLGFTGTAAFADPEHDLVYVFLSNRTYPDMNNNRLGKKNIRPKIQSIIYQSFLPPSREQS